MWEASIWRVTDQNRLLSRSSYFFLLFSYFFALCSKIVFRIFLGYAFTLLNESWKQASISRVTCQFDFRHGRLNFHELLPFVQNRLSRLFLTILSHIWMKVGNKIPFEELKTFVTVDLLFHELLPFVQNSFSVHFTSMLSHTCTWMKVGRKLPYEEVQIKFDFRRSWPTFSWVIWKKVGWKLHYEYLQMNFPFINDLLPFLKISRLFFLQHEELYIKFETSNNKIKHA